MTLIKLDRTLTVDVDKVNWCKADGPYTEICEDSTVHIASKTLSKVANILGEGFVRVNRSLLVAEREIVEKDREYFKIKKIGIVTIPRRKRWKLQDKK